MNHIFYLEERIDIFPLTCFNSKQNTNVDIKNPTSKSENPAPSGINPRTCTLPSYPSRSMKTSRKL